jgi:hypothetical protein
LVAVVAAVAVLAGGVFAPAAEASPTVTSNANATLTLVGGQSVSVAGNIALTVQRFEVDDDSIVLVGRLSGQLSGTLEGVPVTATFSNVRVVAAITNLQANCAAGTLSFNYRITVPTRGITVTVGGLPVQLRGAITLRGSVAITTAQIAEIDAGLAEAVGTLICQIETLLETGVPLEDVVAALNAVLNSLP